MDILLLGIYAFFVWLIFIKFKWLPWNITSQVIVVTIPIVALTIMILTLNVVAPSSAKLRVFKYTIPIVSQVRGRVLEVPVEEGNVLVHKGDVLFRVDPTPYALDVANLEAQLAIAQGGQRETEETLTGANAKVIEARAAIAQAGARITEVDAKLALARKRVEQNRELAQSGAGTRFDLEQAEANLAELVASRESARSAQAQAQASEAQSLASVGQVKQKLGTKVDGTYAQVAQIRAQLGNAKWLLEQTTTLSPCECYVINLQLRPGAFVAGLPLNPVMTLVEATGRWSPSMRRTSSPRCAGGRSRVRTRNLSGSDHQGHGEFDYLGDRAGSVAGHWHHSYVGAGHSAARNVRRQVQHRRA